MNTETEQTPAEQIAELQARIASFEAALPGFDADAQEHARMLIAADRAMIGIIRRDAGIPITVENSRPSKSPASPDGESVSAWRPAPGGMEERSKVIRKTELVEYRGSVWWSQKTEIYKATREAGREDAFEFFRYQCGHADGLGIEHL